MAKEIYLHDIGESFYKTSLSYQLQIVEKKLYDRSYPDFLIITEHSPVITLGKRGGKEFIDKSSTYFLDEKPSIVETNRGGLVTCHMPGQIVLYPILNLKNYNLGVKEYSFLLMNVISDFLKKYGIDSYESKDYPGVWIEDKKIGNIGLGIKKNIAFHGLSINIDNRKDLFDIVTPCGIKDAQVTRLIDETDIDVSSDIAKTALVDSFAKIFKIDLIKDEI